MQCYHLPGNNWKQDLCQFIANNHPIFGIFFHHKLHPIDAKTRIVALVGTLVFGLALTSFFELLYIRYPGYQKTLLSFGDSEGGWQLTSGMLSLWTVGGGIHTAYNLFMWHIAACSCMRAGGCMESAKCCHCPNCGKTFLRIFVLVIIALTIFVVCLKVVIAKDGDADIEDVADIDNYQNADDFGFILAYLVGMGLSLFLWYFLGLFVLFSGVLGCYRLPVLGGRPREVKIEEKLLAKSRSGSTNPFDDIEQSSSFSRKNSSGSSRGGSKKGSSFLGLNRSESMEERQGRGSPNKGKRKGRKKNQDSAFAANDLEARTSPKKKRGKRKKTSSGELDVERPPSAKKPLSNRQKKKQQGRVNSSKLVFEPL